MRKSKYEEIAQNILLRIADGSYAGGRIPPIKKLAEEYGVTAVTANHAVKHLERLGAVTCRNGNAGTHFNSRRVSDLVSGGTPSFLVDNSLLPSTGCILRFECGHTQYHPLFQALAVDFSEEYPWARVEITSASASESDCMLFSGHELMALTRRKSLSDLTELSSPFWKTRRNFPRIRECCSDENGHIFALPFFLHIPLQFVRKGTPYLRTWRALLKEAEHGDLLIHFGLISLLTMVAGDLHRLSGSDGEKHLMEIMALLKAVTRNPLAMQTLWNPHFHPLPEQLSGIRLILSNLLFDRMFSYPCNEEWEVFPLPTHPHGGSLLQTELLAIRASTETPWESWLWLSFLMRTENLMRFNTLPGFLSADPDVLEQADIPLSVKELLKNAGTNGIPTRLSIKAFSVFYQTVLPVLEKYIGGTLGKEETLLRFQRSLKEVILIDQCL